MNARLVLALLVAANALVFAYQLFTPDRQSDAGARIEELQINPGRIRIQGVATRGPGSGTASARTGAYRACLEWGPFAAGDAAKAESALAKLALPQPPMQRSATNAGGARRYSFFVPDPDNDKAAKIAALQRTFPATEIKAGPCPS
ncbi:MAG TPA: hypothetical protein VED01_18680 [Burkholderiales bacterium]|nr:hypothetical protein [Burkholderiales bacterium]